MYYTIQQVSNKMCLPTYTLRYYEKEGLLPSIERSKGGIRRFSEEDLDWLGLISCLKSTGMPIKQIKEFVDLSREGDQTLEQRCAILIEHKRTVEEHFKLMEQQLQKVTMKIGCYTEQCENYKSRAKA